EVAGGQRSGRSDAVAQLDGLEVGQQFLVEQRQAVAKALVVLCKAKAYLRVGRVACHRELGAADLMPAKQVADRLDGLELVVEIGLEVELHFVGPFFAGLFDVVAFGDGSSFAAASKAASRARTPSASASAGRCASTASLVAVACASSSAMLTLPLPVSTFRSMKARNSSSLCSRSVRNTCLSSLAWASA